METPDDLHRPARVGSPASYFYEELSAAVGLAPDYGRVYQRFRQVFHQLIDQHTERVKMVFRGPYPKTDYLLKRHNAPWPVRKGVNDTRIRLRNLCALTDSELESNCLHDFKSLCEFVSLIYGERVPDSLARIFPAEYGRRDEPHHAALADCVRMMVNSWDERHFYGQIEDQETERDVAVAFQTRRGDWSYLRGLFSADCQVNLVRPRWVDGNAEVEAELIIYEPDYLVDVSNIAGCFEQYAISPFVSLIKKIKPNHPTEATLLGNLAGEVLDKTLRTPDGKVDLRDAARRFMERNALCMAALGRDERAKMWTDIQAQAVHIAEVLQHALPDILGEDYHPEQVMVEPTFFVEMLGIQGRMDFFQTDGSLVIEQKSGKGAFPYDGFVTPRATEQHIVQVSLYAHMLRYARPHTGQAPRRNLHSFLLYSRYTNSLYAQGDNASDLLFEAVKVRNKIAWHEERYALGDGFKWLGALTADKLNLRNVSNNLWLRWQKPEIDDLLDVIRQASPTEQAYFYRMMRFVACEHLLAKTGGNKNRENAGFAAKWHDSLEEKLEAGNIYASLRLVEPASPRAGRYSHPDGHIGGRVGFLRFEFQETGANDMANFRTGDIVVAYPYDAGTEPDVRKNMVFRCTVEALSAHLITLRLRAPQSSARMFLVDAHRPWAIEHDFFESSFSSLYRGLYAFLQAPQHRRDLLLMRREAETDTAVATLRTEVPAPFRQLALRVRQARDLFLIIGPPGTGKTSFGLMTTVREQLADGRSHVLLTAYTNRAVDEICGKLIEEGVDFIRMGNRLSASPESRPYLLDERVPALRDAGQVEELIRNTRVFVGTTASLSTQQTLFQLKSFDLAVIDEASQILEPHILPILAATHCGEAAIRKIVMIGDHKQLPAVVQQSDEESAVDDPLLHAIGLTNCRLSLFERLLRHYGGDERFSYMLTRQGRMHPDIALFPSLAFYSGKLRVVPRPHQTKTLPPDYRSRDGLRRILRTRRISFLAVGAPAETPSDKVNQAEADVIAALVLRIYQKNKRNFDATDTVGVIVPYRNQIATVRNTLARSGIGELDGITIDTVERYQGSQRRWIVYGFTIQRRHQLKFLTNNTFVDTDGTVVDRKLNVAMTRAKEGLVMVGNPQLLAVNPTFASLLRFVRDRQGYFEAPLADMVAGRFDVPPFSPESIEDIEDI